MVWFFLLLFETFSDLCVPNVSGMPKKLPSSVRVGNFGAEAPLLWESANHATTRNNTGNESWLASYFWPHNSRDHHSCHAHTCQPLKAFLCFSQKNKGGKHRKSAQQKRKGSGNCLGFLFLFLFPFL